MYRSISGADMGMRSKTDWDMITASQFPVAIRATNCVPAVGLQVVVPGGQHAGLGVELEELALELLQHVVGDHDRGLGGQAEAAQLHRAHRHLGGLARPDVVGEQDGGLVDDPRDGGELVRVHPFPEPRRQARQRWAGRRRRSAAPGC